MPHHALAVGVRRDAARAALEQAQAEQPLQVAEQAMKGLSEEERDMVRRLDWKAMQDYGANFFCLEKLGRTMGVSNPEMVAHFRGETLEQFLKTRRVPGAR
jgi:gallate dioxygenase